MSQLNPSRIVLHCGLHKTGSTYIQKNLQAHHRLLLEQGILFLGPNIFKKRLRELFLRTKKGSKNKKIRQQQQSKTRDALLELAGSFKGDIHTIMLSWESIFGELGDLAKPKYRSFGLYGDSYLRTSRLISGLEESLQNRSIAWSILFVTRDQEAFIRSCHNQLLKAGNKIENSLDTFKKTTNFSHVDPNKIKQNLSKLCAQRKVNIVSIPYEEIIDPNEPTTLLWNFLNQSLPEQAKLLQEQMNANEARQSAMNKKYNKGLNQRGLELASQAQPLFSNGKEWKLFRQFLKKHYSSS